MGRQDLDPLESDILRFIQCNPGATEAAISRFIGLVAEIEVAAGCLALFRGGEIDAAVSDGEIVWRTTGAAGEESIVTDGVGG